MLALGVIPLPLPRPSPIILPPDFPAAEVERVARQLGADPVVSSATPRTFEPIPIPFVDVEKHLPKAEVYVPPTLREKRRSKAERSARRDKRAERAKKRR